MAAAPFRMSLRLAAATMRATTATATTGGADGARGGGVHEAESGARTMATDGRPAAATGTALGATTMTVIAALVVIESVAAATATGTGTATGTRAATGNPILPRKCGECRGRARRCGDEMGPETWCSEAVRHRPRRRHSRGRIRTIRDRSYTGDHRNQL